MYLLIWRNNEAKFLIDNLSISDILAVRQKILSIFRIKGEAYQMLVADEKSLTWVPVKEARHIFAGNEKVNI